MKITIEIDEQEIMEEVKAVVIRNAVKKVEEHEFNYIPCGEGERDE